MGHRTLCRDGRGFTLIELLVVVAVIGILASLLLPSILRAMRSATTANCKSNIRQIGQAVQVYKQNNGNMFLPWGQARWDGDTGYGDTKAWPMPVRLLEAAGIAKENEVWVCPADRVSMKRLETEWWKVSYTFSQFVDYIPDSDVERPGQTIPFMCGFWDGAWIESNDMPYLKLTLADYKRHAGKFTAIFYDGHVEMLKAEETEDKQFRPK